ncbi:MAG: DUF3467 domain-containing protein [Paludibacteraceae bacterium]|nr:DUF3467 domain-containing protein [Paludibacteraceae bacterium]
MKEEKIDIHVSEQVAEGTYANLALIAHSPAEFILDFARIMPGQKQSNVQARIIMNPRNAKQLLAALQDNIAKYERQYGNIPMGNAGGESKPLSYGGGEA